MFRFATWNLRDYGKRDSLTERARCAAIPEILRDLADVIAVQEVYGLDQLDRLAEAAGLYCRVPADAGRGDSHPAFDPGRRLHGMGLLWNGAVAPVPGSVKTYERSALYHGMVRADFKVDGVVIRAASTHLTPTGLNLRFDEACMIARMLGDPSGPMLVGLDQNSVSATRRADGTFYDKDPFADRAWQPRFLDKCRWTMNGGHEADRMPAAAMDRGGLFDMSAEIGAPWQATVGHWPSSDTKAPKRIDVGRATRVVVDAVVSSTVVDTPVIRKLSDHLPVVYEIDVEWLAGLLRSAE